MWVEWPRGRVAALQVPPTCTKYNPLFLFYVTDMAAVSLFWCSSPSGFFWRSSGFFWRSSGVLLAFFCVLLAFFCVIEHQKNARRTPEEHQKNTRRTQKNPEEPRRRRTPAPPSVARYSYTSSLCVKNQGSGTVEHCSINQAWLLL